MAFDYLHSLYYPVTEGRGGYVQLLRQLCNRFSLLLMVDDLGFELYEVSLVAVLSVGDSFVSRCSIKK